MLVVLPPSETKSHGGNKPAVDFESLSFPALNPIRKTIATDLSALEGAKALDVLGLSAKQSEWLTVNQQLLTSPCTPAILRFTGVLYDALEASSLSEKALNRIAIGDALFGLVMAHDAIPNYRLSGSTKLPSSTTNETPTMRKRWGKAISAVLADYEGLVIDLRSGTYQQLGKCPQAVTVKVLSEQPDGSRKVISHFNKHYKGRLAKVLAESPADATDLLEVAEIARAAGMVIEIQPDSQELLMII